MPQGCNLLTALGCKEGDQGHNCFTAGPLHQQHIMIKALGNGIFFYFFLILCIHRARLSYRLV